MDELKPCPFCQCSMEVESNRDWHRLVGRHEENCVFDTPDPAITVPADDQALAWAITVWNTRAASGGDSASLEQRGRDAFEVWFAAVEAGDGTIPVPQSIADGQAWHDHIGRRQIAQGAWFEAIAFAGRGSQHHVPPLTWQSMEGAPRDGTAILAMLPDSDMPIVIRHRERSGWHVAWDDHRLGGFDQPVKWMPCPDTAPQQREARDVAVTDTMVDSYLAAQAKVVQEVDDKWGNGGKAASYLHPIREACRAGLAAALANQQGVGGWRFSKVSGGRDGDAWEIYDDTGSGGVVSNHDVKDWLVRKLLDNLATKHAAPAVEIVGEIVRAGDDEEGQPRIVVRTTRLAIQAIAVNPIGLSVRVTATQPAGDVGREG